MGGLAILVQKIKGGGVQNLQYSGGLFGLPGFNFPGGGLYFEKGKALFKVVRDLDIGFQVTILVSFLFMLTCYTK